MGSIFQNRFSRTLLLTSIVSLTVVSMGNSSSIDHYKNFSLKLFSIMSAESSNFDQLTDAFGVAIGSPFGVAYTVSIINDENRWKVSKKGIAKLLNSTDKQIHQEYQFLVNTLKQGKMVTSIKLFAPAPKSGKSPFKFTFLDREMEIIQIDESWRPYQKIIYSQSARSKGKISTTENFDSLLKGAWFGNTFHSYTTGILFNKINYNSQWDFHFTSIGLQKFNDETFVPFFETEGYFPHYDGEEYTAVSISFNEGGKSMVFILPKPNSQRIGLIKPLFQMHHESPKNWKTQLLKIQIPTLNISLTDQHLSNFKTLGVTETFCEVSQNKNHQNFMGPIVQRIVLQLNGDGIYISTGTGISINSKTIFNNGFWRSKRQVTVPESSNVKPLKKSGATGFLHEPETKTKHWNFNQDLNIRVDKAFLWFLFDEKIGPLYFGIVDSLKIYQEASVPENQLGPDTTWLIDFTKSHLWECP